MLIVSVKICDYDSSCGGFACHRNTGSGRLASPRFRDSGKGAKIDRHSYRNHPHKLPSRLRNLRVLAPLRLLGRFGLVLCSLSARRQSRNEAPARNRHGVTRCSALTTLRIGFIFYCDGTIRRRIAVHRTSHHVRPAAPVRELMPTRKRYLPIFVGQVFNRLRVIAPAEMRAGKYQTWLCECACGNTSITMDQSLKTGHAKSCGCLQRESARRVRRTHGESPSGSYRGTPEHQAWRAMRVRCLYAKGSHYERYGGRGITICQRWSEYVWFLVDVGPQPGPGYTIDRIDNDGNYEPGNVRWATRQEQQQNMIRNHNLTLDGETHCLAEWERKSGVNHETLRGRLKAGYSPEEALRPGSFARVRRFIGVDDES